MTYTDLTLILPLAVLLHVTEEFLYPGGFVAWYAEWRPPKTPGVRTGFLVWINTLMMAACVPSAHLGSSKQGAAMWFAVAAIAAVNAIYHVVGVVQLKKYSPGVVTGVALYLPVFAYGARLLLSSGLVTPTAAAVSLAGAIGYHVWSYRRQGA